MELKEARHRSLINNRSRIYSAYPCSKTNDADTLLLDEIGLKQRDLTPIHCNNISTITITHDATYHMQTKHIRIYYHFIHERVASNEVSLIYVTSKDNVADIMMKSIPPDNHTKLKELLGITDYKGSNSLWVSVGMHNSCIYASIT